MSEAYPQYRCHKVVRAFKIGRIERDPISEQVEFLPEEATLPPFRKGWKFFARHSPHVGGYIVFYEDGYVSYSPAKPFESGYSRMEEERAPQ